MQAPDKKALFFELADTLLQSWWTVVAGICIGLSGALVVLSFTESWYMANAKIYVTPELSREIARPVVADDMPRRMAALKEAVLSDRYMRRMAEEIYGEAETEEMLELQVKRVRKRIQVTPTTLGPQSGPEALYAFDLTYIDIKPERAAQAANLLAEFYIQQNTEFRTKQSQDTAEAAAEQAARAKEDFDSIDRKLIQFREQHRFETGEHQDANIKLMEGRQDELQRILDSRRNFENQLADLQGRLHELEDGATSGATAVFALRRELEQLLTQYSEEHPKVILQRRKLQEALDSLGAPAEARREDAANYPADPQTAVVRGQIESARRELAALDEREAGLRKEIGEYERRIATVPQVQPQLSRLETEHAMLRQRHEKLQATADQAAQALFLEKALRGESFELAGRAEVPTIRFYPDAKRFCLIGILAGCLLFVGPLFAWRFLNPLISSESGLRALSDVPVLVALPRIETASTRGYLYRRRAKNVLLSTLCTAVVVTAFIFLG